VDCGINIDVKGFIKSKVDGNSGHTFITSLEELIHNSIDANASKIYILHNSDGLPIIVDNGNGMDDAQMESLTIMHKHINMHDKNTIGKYGIGLKDAIFCLGKKWHILSKKKGSEDLSFASFNIDAAKEYLINSNQLHDKIIRVGNAKHFLQKKYKNILKNIGFDIENDNYTAFSGTMMIQYDDSNSNTILDDDFEQDFEKNYELFYDQLKTKIVDHRINIYHGNYSIIEKDNINISSISHLPHFDWLNWKNKITGNHMEFNIYTYITISKALRLEIKFKDTKYLSKKNSSFELLM